MRTRRFFVFLLTFALFVALSLTGVFVPRAEAATTASGTCGDNLTWSLENGKLTISGTGAMTEYSFFSTAPWYPNRGQITSVVIKKGVTSIGRYAFLWCESLASITISDSVISIGDCAFHHCINLTSITIPDSVVSIGDYAFYHCTSLTGITIPDSVTGIGDHVFSFCTSLTNLNVASGNSVYHSARNCIIETDSKTLIIGCKSSVIPADGSVTSIGVYAFKYCKSLTSLIIPDGVASIGEEAFSDCTSLTSITIPDSVTSIGEGAFFYCENLTDITLPEGITSIEDFLFGGSGLTSITIPDSVTSIGESAFWSCESLTSITIPDSVTSIGRDSFSYCSSMTNLKVASGNSVYHSAGNCIIETDSKTLIIGCKSSVIPTDGSVTSIGDGAFDCCINLKSITIPKSVTSIGDEAFCHCNSLTSITIPDSVTSIGAYAFKYCESLTSITIPDSVTSIGSNAFLWCDSLTDVYFTGTKADWNAIEIATGNEDLTNATIHFNSAPLVINKQPVSQTVKADKTAKFTVEASGDGLTYQWQYQTPSSSKWKNSTASSATTKTLKVTATTARDGRQYRCKITDSEGKVVYTDAVTLHVLGITSQPASVSVTDGTSVKFTVKATGDDLSYQWQYRTSSTGSWKNSSASTATKATIKINGTTSKNGYQYRCKVTDSAGNVVYSDPATLTVLSGISVTAQPADAHIVTGDTAKFKVKATGDSLTYQWQYRTSSSGSWKNSTASSAVTATVKVTGKTSRNGYQYRCKITDSAGNVVYSEPATLYVLGMTTQPGSVSVSNGTSVKFTVKATGDGLTYQWQYRTSSSGTWKNSGASTATKATIKINGTTSKNGYQYRCKITDSAGNVVYSNPATLTMASVLTAFEVLLRTLAFFIQRVGLGRS